MDDRQGSHRGTPNPLEFPVGRWTLLGVCALVASLFFVFDHTGWRIAVGVGLFAVSMTALSRAARLIKRGYPELDKDD